MKLEVRTDKLAELRIKQGLSQTELARGAGITGGYMSQIESGLSTPSPKVAKLIAEVLRTDFDTIFLLKFESTKEVSKCIK